MTVPAPRARRLVSILLTAAFLLAAAPVRTTTASQTSTPTSSVQASSISPAGDVERLWVEHCLAWERIVVPNKCAYGNRAGTFTIALVGDSHASHLFPAVEAMAKARGWRLEVFVKVSCPFIDMKVSNIKLGREYRECATWNAAVIKRIAALRPDMTLVAMSRRAIHPVRPSDNTDARKGAAIGRMLRKLVGPVTMIVDSPFPNRDVPACIRSRGARACAIPRTTAFSYHLGTIEKIAVRVSGDRLINLTSSICPSAGSCPVVVNNRIVYRDKEHLTATFARSLSAALDRALMSIMGASPAGA